MKYICFFTDRRATELALVGGKGTNLGKMTRAGFPVPPGFCITAEAYRFLVDVTGLGPIIARKVNSIDFEDPEAVAGTAGCLRELIGQQPIPLEIALEIETAYRMLGKQMGIVPPQEVPVAVRSSATAEDLPDTSFAGQHDTFLNIQGCTPVLEHVRHCWTSLWTTRAVTYRHRQGFEQQQVLPAVVVQSMIEPETAGVAFTINPINGSRKECVINASWGLGEATVCGVVSPDTYVVSKRSGRIQQKQIASKKRMIHPNSAGGVVEMDTAVLQWDAPTLDDRQAAILTALTSRIEDHYGVPQEIEWGYNSGQWHILQSRSMTTLTDVDHVSTKFSLLRTAPQKVAYQ